MPCLAVLLALFFPRLILVVLWLFTRYLDVYQTVLWPLLGFLFMPYTTLAYAWALHAGGGTVSGPPLVVVILAVLLDLGVIGGGAQAQSRRG
jgi:hypothetical protein